MSAPAEALITAHVWRAPYQVRNTAVPHSDRPCAYMSCGRSRAEHARSFRPASQQPHAARLRSAS